MLFCFLSYALFSSRIKTSILTILSNTFETQDRAYGCPSIRYDLPKGDPQRRSLADTQNYGDDVPARDLVNPPAFSDLAIEPMTMSQYRNKSKMLELFVRIGMTFRPEVGEALFAEAAQGFDMATINDFRNAAVNYEDCVRRGQEGEWLSSRNL